MTKFRAENAGNLDCIKSDGTLIPAQKFGANKGCTLLAATTYYVPLGAAETSPIAETALLSFQAKWDASIVITSITIETCDFPLQQDGLYNGPVDVSNVDAVAGNWIPQQPTTAYVAVVGGTQTPSTMTVTVAGGAAGGADFELGNLGSRRARAKVVVAGTGGLMRFGYDAKVAT